MRDNVIAWHNRRILLSFRHHVDNILHEKKVNVV